jgi:hypothetical protein
VLQLDQGLLTDAHQAFLAAIEIGDQRHNEKLSARTGRLHTFGMHINSLIQ